MGLSFLCNILLYSIRFCFHHQTHPKLNIISILAIHFIISGAICTFPWLFPSEVLDTFQSGGLIFWHHIFLPFYAVHVVFIACILEQCAIPSSCGSHLSELSTVAHSTREALYSMAHSFIVLCKPLRRY